MSVNSSVASEEISLDYFYIIFYWAIGGLKGIFNIIPLFMGLIKCLNVMLLFFDSLYYQRTQDK